MMMNGKQLKTMSELMQNFCIDEFIGAFYSGELEYFLRKCGEDNTANLLCDIPHNAYLLVRLYEILDVDPQLTEEKVRRYHA